MADDELSAPLGQHKPRQSAARFGCRSAPLHRGCCSGCSSAGFRRPGRCWPTTRSAASPSRSSPADPQAARRHRHSRSKPRRQPMPQPVRQRPKPLRRRRRHRRAAQRSGPGGPRQDRHHHRRLHRQASGGADPRLARATAARRRAAPRWKTSRHGGIPRIAPDGARPSEVYARPVKPSAGQPNAPRSRS